MKNSKDSYTRILRKSIITAAVALIAVASCFALPSFAVSANPFTKQMTQPDGTVIDYTMYGNEVFSWIEDADGYIVAHDENDALSYVVDEFGELVVSDVTAGSGDVPENAITDDEVFRTFELPADLNNNDYYATYGDIFSTNSFDGVVTNATGTSNVGASQPVLVVLIGFLDKRPTTTEDYWAEKFFGGSDSVSALYNEMSGGRFSFAPAQETSGTANNGVMCVNLSSVLHPCTTSYTSTQMSQENMSIKTALVELNSYINFAAYDKDGNKNLSSSELNLVFIFAGYEASYSADNQKASRKSVWAHADSNYLFGTFDGIRINRKFIVMGELYDIGIPASIGTAAHELGHSLGLPDLYDYGSAVDNVAGESGRGVGIYSLMASGNWGFTGNNVAGSCPVHLDAWSKLKLGFYDETQIAEVHAGQSVTEELVATALLTSGKKVVKMYSNQENDMEYFLAENRQLTGFDAGLGSLVSGGGVLIYHVDERVIAAGGKINENAVHKGVDVEEPNGTNDLDNTDITLNYINNHFYANTGFEDGRAVFTEAQSLLYNCTETHVADSNCGTAHVESVPSGVTLSVLTDSGDYMTVCATTYSLDGNSGSDELYDFTNDGAVTINDLILLQLNKGTSNLAFDLDGDGDVDNDDTYILYAAIRENGLLSFAANS